MKNFKRLSLVLSLLLSAVMLLGPTTAYAEVINGFDTAKVFNVAAALNGGTASATSTLSSNYPPSRIVDISSDQENSWRSTDTVVPSVASPQAVAIKFNKPQTIFRVRWLANNDVYPQTPKNYEIQYATNPGAAVNDSPYSSNWASVTNMTNGTAGQEMTNGFVSGNKVTNNLYNSANTVVSHTFDPVLAYGIRMVITDKNGGRVYVALRELEVYGNNSQNSFNVATSYNGGAADATSWYNQYQEPDHVNNSIIGDGWVSANVAPTALSPHVVGLKFKAKMIVNKLKWVSWSNSSPQTPKNYELQYAVNETASIKDAVNSPNWAPVAAMTNGDNGQEMTDGNVSGNTVTNSTMFQPNTAVSHTFTPVAAYGMRMIITDKNGTSYQYVAVSEMEVYGNYEGVVTPPVNPIPAPANLKVSNVTDTSLTLSWDAVTHPELVGYMVYQNGVHISSIAANVTAVSFQNLKPGIAYTFGVTATTTNGAESPMSAPVQVTTFNSINPPPGGVQGGTVINSGTSISNLNIYNSTVTINITNNSYNYNNMYPMNPGITSVNMLPAQ